MGRQKWFGMLLVALASLAWCGLAHADLLTIYEIQSDTSDGDASSYDGQTHDVVGGIVTHTWAGFNDRVYLRDPDHPTWGAICVKDWVGDVVGAVEVGDWVEFTQITIEEFRGTTFLQYDPTANPSVDFNVVSTGNPVPAPTVLTAADLIVPVDHTASEPYESMVVTLEDVDVGTIGLGKAEDNYELLQGSDVAWGADYMNVDKVGDYHPWIYPGAELESITGMVEQYTKLSDGWDYYQLLTRSSADIVPEPATLGLLLAGAVLVGRRGR